MTGSIGIGLGGRVEKQSPSQRNFIFISIVRSRIELPLVSENLVILMDRGFRVK